MPNEFILKKRKNNNHKYYPLSFFTVDYYLNRKNMFHFNPCANVVARYRSENQTNKNVAKGQNN